ncbi:MAG: tRNA threonylcarbamoyladenosine dehydratase [Lachnospiraceae bacterium]|nr:tRNA threonylcarbamoyladenosine dehydratase [Lachnospiraceae bacterium]
MDERFQRSAMLFGPEGMARLEQSRVAVFGLGGVGGCAAEALARSGVGSLELIDNDTVSLTNLNRQILASVKTLGMYKTDAARERILSINPNCRVRTRRCFFLPETAEDFHFEEYDYVVDAIDTVTGKIAIILKAREAGTPVISSMGTGNKLDPSGLKIADIYETSVDPLARVMRRELKKRGVSRLKVVYSEEKPLLPRFSPDEDGKQTGRPVPGSTAFVPPAAGLMIASAVVRDLLYQHNRT